MAQRILVPFDFSPAAEQALAWARTQVQSGGGGTVRVFHVVNPVSMPSSPVPVPAPVPRELVDETARVLRDKVASLGPNVTSDVFTSSEYADVIVEEAERWRADMIVMGTHGRSGVSRMVLGSVAEHVVRHAPCPVVTVRKPPRQRPHEPVRNSRDVASAEPATGSTHDARVRPQGPGNTAGAVNSVPPMRR